MKKYEAPVAELELFAVENIMADYPTDEVTEEGPAVGENDLPFG